MAESERDIVLVFRAFKSMHDESKGEFPGPFMPEKVLGTVMRMVRGDNACVLVAMDGDNLAGVLALCANVYWWNEDRFLEDKGLYVLPDYRKAGVCEALTAEADEIGKGLGLEVIIWRRMKRKPAHQPKNMAKEQ